MNFIKKGIIHFHYYYYRDKVLQYCLYNRKKNVLDNMCNMIEIKKGEYMKIIVNINCKIILFMFSLLWLIRD